MENEELRNRNLESGTHNQENKIYSFMSTRTGTKKKKKQEKNKSRRTRTSACVCVCVCVFFCTEFLLRVIFPGNKKENRTLGMDLGRGYVNMS